MVSDFDFGLLVAQSKHIFQNQKLEVIIMQMKKFHLGDVLSITTGLLVSPRHIDGVYDILGFITEGNLFTRPLEQVRVECRPYLIEQFPQLAGDEMDSAVTELGDSLGSNISNAGARKVVADWLAKQVSTYGETFAVKSLPVDAYREKNQIAEVIAMRGGCQKMCV